MQKLASIPVRSKDRIHEIAFYHGDLTAIPESERVELLVVSAFPNDYSPTPSSLIGALANAGLSVARLSASKELDLRAGFGCWLSRPVGQYPGLAFDRIMVFETMLGPAPEVIGDLFRALTPFVLGEPQVNSIALPVLASGDQNEDSSVMLKALIDAAIGWLQIGLPISTIKIVERDREKALHLASQVTALVGKITFQAKQSAQYDYFVSYSHTDKNAADEVVRALTARSSAKVFLDRKDIATGASWQRDIWAGLEKCRRVIALISPEYLLSDMCQEEWAMAMIRRRDENPSVLVPIYLRSADLPLHVRMLQYQDCRESDLEKLRGVCSGITVEPVIA